MVSLLPLPGPAPLPGGATAGWSASRVLLLPRLSRHGFRRWWSLSEWAGVPQAAQCLVSQAYRSQVWGTVLTFSGAQNLGIRCPSALPSLGSSLPAAYGLGQWPESLACRHIACVVMWLPPFLSIFHPCFLYKGTRYGVTVHPNLVASF